MPIGIYEHKPLSEETKIKIGKGNTGKKRSIKTKKKISEARKGIKLSEKHKKKISEALIGRISAMLGKKHSEETRKKMSEGRKGKHHSKETKRKIAQRLRGIKRSRETRQKISQALIKRFAQMTKKEKLEFLLPATKAAQTFESRQKARIAIKENWDRMTKEEKRERTKLWGIAGQKSCHSLEARQRMAKTKKEQFAEMTKKEKLKVLDSWINAGRVNPSFIEKAICKVLDKLDVNYKTQVPFNNGKFIADIYVPSRRLIIECNGDYWHDYKIFPKRKERDESFEEYANKNNFKLIWLWESEIRKNPKLAFIKGLRKAEIEEMKKHA